MPMKLRFVALVVLLAAGAGALSSTESRATSATTGRGLVTRAGAELRLDGRPFRFAGTNNYYLPYASQLMVDDVLQTAAAQGFDVVRTWGFLDQPKNGVQFQSWDATAGKPVYDDGPNGLQHLDYVIATAGQLGLKLVIPVTNNWSDFGGMDQYIQWRAASAGSGTWYHDSFYTDPVIKQWYQAWISHLLNHVNSITHVKYKDDPTIVTWELANEPRCKGSGGYPASPTCNTTTLLRWADETSTYIKGIDRNHLVSVGDEGFYCHPGAADWTDNCGEGVDTEAFARLKNIDVMSFHLYPDSWGMTADWGTSWITSHFAAARRVGKPAMLGEFGLLDKKTRNPVYKDWLDAAFWSGGAGALYWILSGKQDDGSLYPDYDGFTVYCPSPVCTTIGNFGKQMKTGLPIPFSPVADVDTATTEFETTVTVSATANDISYLLPLVPRTIDLDPSSTSRQTTATVTGGKFTAANDGTVTFVPATGFSGNASVSYIVRDLLLRSSNVATITVHVKPSPTAPLALFDFEGGTEGWAQANWQTGASTATQSAANASHGTHSLAVHSVDDGYWFGASFPVPVDLSTRTVLRYDITSTTGTGASLALQLGPSYTWCQLNASGWFTTPHVGDADTDAGGAIAFDLTSLDASCRSLLNDVRGMFISVNSGSDTSIDYVRAN